MDMFQQIRSSELYTAAVLLSTNQEASMRKEQESAPKDEPGGTDNQQSSVKLRATAASKIPSSGITQPHSAKKEALGPNTKR